MERRRTEGPARIGDRYEIRRELGQGGFGTTYAALDRTTGKEVAIKLLDLGRINDWKAVDLFEREAATLKKLDHPGIPAYIEFCPLEVDKQAYLVQELAPGESLDKLMTKRRFSEGDLASLAERVLEILRYLTTLHPIVIHRDVKPGNIVLAEDGTVRLVDFGAVRAAAETAMGGDVTVAGTFGYMAPEQLQGLAGPSSDLYGLGMTLVHMATGREPSELPAKRLKPDFKPHAELSPAFEAFIDRLIEPVPDDRYPAATDALSVLRRVRDSASEPLDTERAREQRADTTSVPSAAEIDAMAAQAGVAERIARERARRTKTHARPRGAVDRVDLVEDADGATVTIRPGAGWRGREMHLGIVSMLAFLSLFVVGSAFGVLGIVLAIAAFIAIVALILVTAPTFHLRLINSGNFVLYTRNPKRPRWVGRGSDLHLTTVPTAHGGRLVTLQHEPTERGMTVYPLSGSDVHKLERAARLGRMKTTQVN